jgi:hypothetical protein
MRSSLKLVKRFVHKCELTCLVVFCVLSTHAIAQTRAAAVGSSSSGQATLTEHDPLVDAAFDHFYNMD